MRAINHYLKRVVPEHKHPKFLEWLRTNVETVSDSERAVLSYDYEFDIDNAIGIQLDMIGDIVGRKRLLDFQPRDGSHPRLNDDMYRIVLKAKIGINHWDGTFPSMYGLWQNLFPEYKIFIQDNQDMTMAVHLEGYTPILLCELVRHDYIIPRPEGVGLNLWIHMHEEFEAYDYIGGTIKELIQEFIAEKGQTTETAIDYHAAAIYETLKEDFTK